MAQTYRIRVSNRLGPALRRSFAGMRAVVIPRQTVLEGWLSPEEFRTLLQRVDQVGVQLVQVNRTTHPETPEPPRPDQLTPPG